MADTVDSLSITLTADTSSAEESINKLIGRLALLKVAVQGASNFTKIAAGIKRIADAAKQIDTDSGKKLSDLARGLTDLSKVGDLSNLADAGKNISSVVRAVNSMGQSGGNGLSGLADGIKQTGDALGGIKDADVSKLGAVRDALSGEMSGSLHQANEAIVERPALGGSVSQNYDLGLVNPAAVSIYERIAYAINEATAAYREFRSEVGSSGGIAGLLGDGAVGGAMTVFKFTADSIRDATAAYREFQAALGSGVPPIFTNFADDAGQAGGSVRMLTGSVGGQQQAPLEADEIRDAARAYDDLGNSASRAADVIETEFVNPFENFKMKPLEDELPRITLNPIDSNIADSANNAAGAFGNLSGVLGGLSGVLGPVASGLGAVGKAMFAIPKYFGGQLIGNIKSATKGMTGFFNSIVRIAKYRLIRTALRMLTQGINDGIKNLYAFSHAASGTFAASMDKIATASQYMGNSFAAMASPLVEALAPAIDFIVDKFVAMFNTISQIIARLTGKSTYTAAKKVAATWGGAAKSASNSAKEAADEIKRTLMGFDEINKLNDMSDKASGGGGGGGGSGGGAGSMFEELPIDGAVSSFADSLKAAFEEGNWQELGTILGTKVNELVDSIDFAGAGQKVGYYINAWFSTKYWTLDTINFTNIGSKIAEFLNNAIKEIHFDIIGASLVQKLTIIGDLIIGFFTDFDWGQAADKFSDFVKGIYNEISKWLDKYDWGDVGNTIYTKLNDALTNLDLSGIATSFVTALGKAIKAVVSAGAGFLAGFWADVTAYWDEHIKAEDFTTTVYNILDAIGQGFSNLGEWVWNSIIKPFGTALTGNENWDTELSDVGKNIIEGIFNGIVSVISDVGTWIKTNIFDPFLKWLKSVFGIASPAKTMEEPGENIVLGIFQGIINALKNVGQWVKENIFDPIWGAIKDAGSIAINITVSLVKKVGEWAEDAWEAVKSGAETIVKTVQAIFTEVGTWAGNVWNAVKSGAETIVKTVQAIFTEVGTWAGNVWNAVKAGAETIVKEVKAIFTEVGKWAGNVWDAVKAGAETIIKEVKAIFTEVGEWAGNVWTAIKNGAETIVKTVKAIFTEVGTWAGSVWDAVKAGAETIVKTVKAIFSEVGTWAGNVWNTVKAGAETILKEVKAIFTEVGKWAGNVWNTVKAGAETILKEVKAIFTEVGKWAGNAWDAVKSGAETIIKEVKAIFSEVGSWTGAVWNSVKAGAETIAKTIEASLTKGADWLVDLWNFITGPANIFKTIFISTSTGDEWEGVDKSKSIYSEEYWKDKDLSVQVPITPTVTGDNTALQAQIDEMFGSLLATVKVGLEKTWKVTPLEWLGLDNLSAKVSMAMEKSWKVAALEWLGLNNLSAKVSMAMEKTWKNTALEWLGLNNLSATVSMSMKKTWNNKALEWLGLDNLSATVDMSLKKTWKGTAKSFLGVDDLSDTVEMSLKKSWSGTAKKYLGLEGLTAKVKVKLEKGSPNKITVTKDSDTSWKLNVRKYGGIFANGLWRNIAQYANGTTNAAHGSMFIAGESGPELVGHLGGRTEVLNQSQLAATMFSAVRAAMSGVKIAATMYNGGGENDEADYEMMYRAMYDAFTDAMAGSNERDREKVQLMRQIAAKEFTAEVTAASVNRAQTRMNRRAGTTIVPVGT